MLGCAKVHNCASTLLWISYSTLTLQGKEEYLTSLQRTGPKDLHQESGGHCSFSLRWGDKTSHKIGVIKRAFLSQQINKSFD